jgi:iron complex outermembrane recepter protein
MFFIRVRRDGIATLGMCMIFPACVLATPGLTEGESKNSSERLRVAQAAADSPRDIAEAAPAEETVKPIADELPAIKIEQPSETPAGQSQQDGADPRPVAVEPRPRPAPQTGYALPTVSTGAVGQPATGEAAPESTTPPPTGTVGAPPPPFPGGQVATGGQVGFLGNVDIFDMPFSLTSYTSELIQEQQAITIGDVLENNPSVQTPSAGFGVYDNFLIRGFPVSASVYSLNGLPGVAPAQMVAPEFIERVELFLGPSAMVANAPLFGAVGGSINLVTKKAQDEPLTAWTTGFLSDGQFSNHLDVGRRFGPNKEWGIRFNGVYRDGDTAIDHQEEELGLAALALDYNGRSFRTSLDIGYQEQEWTAPFLSMIYNGPPGEVPRAPSSGSNPFQPWSFNDADDFFVAWNAELDVTENVTVFAGVGYRDDLSILLSPYQEIEDKAGNTTVYPYYEPYSSENTAANAGIRANITTGIIKHELRFGGQTQYVETGYFDTFFASFASNIYDPVRGARPRIRGLSDSPPRNADYTLSSIAVADTLSVFDEAIQFTAGVRGQSIKVHRYDIFTGARLSTYDESAATPAFGLVVKPFNQVSVYANYIEALEEGPVAPSGTVNAGEIFPPSISEQYEVGTKFDFGTLGLTVAAFQITRPAGFIDAASNRFVLAGEQRNRGIEINTFGELTDDIRVLGGVAFIEGILTETENGVDDGNFAPGVPEVRVSLSGEWDVPGLNGVTLLGQVVYTSQQYLNTANNIRLPDWTRVDLGASYETIVFGRDTVFRAMVENVADNSYWESAAEGALTLSTPRRYLVSATAKF